MMGRTRSKPAGKTGETCKSLIGNSKQFPWKQKNANKIYLIKNVLFFSNDVIKEHICSDERNVFTNALNIIFQSFQDEQEQVKHNIVSAAPICDSISNFIQSDLANKQQQIKKVYIHI